MSKSKPQDNTICLQTITGSRAYGLEHAKSDTDRMGIFIAPTLDVAGLFWSNEDESWSDAGPEGDDTSYHEIGKFLRLLLKSNPTLIELLFMDEYEILNGEGEGLVDLRSKILYTDGIRNAYYGYAKAQHARVMREYPNHKPKMARHCLRISDQASQLLSTGECSVRVKDSQRLFDLDHMDYDELDYTLGAAVQDIDTVESVLPSAPDFRAAVDFLRTVRSKY